MSNYGFKISKPGVNVESAADNDLIISSEFDNFIVIQEGSGTSPSGTGDQTVTITNTLDYPSVFYVWEKAGWKTNSWRCNYKSYIDAGDSLKLKIVIAPSTQYYYVITHKRLDNTTSTAKPSTYDYGLKISKPSVNVENAKWDELYFNSSKRNLQVYGAHQLGFTYTFDTFTEFPPDTYQEYSVAHGKSYIPLYRDVCDGLLISAIDYVRFVGPSELYGFFPIGPSTVNCEVCVDSTHIWFRAKCNQGLYFDGLDFIGLLAARALVWIIGGIPS